MVGATPAMHTLAAARTTPKNAGHEMLTAVLMLVVDMGASILLVAFLTVVEFTLATARVVLDALTSPKPLNSEPQTGSMMVFSKTCIFFRGMHIGELVKARRDCTHARNIGGRYRDHQAAKLKPEAQTGQLTFVKQRPRKTPFVSSFGTTGMVMMMMMMMMVTINISVKPAYLEGQGDFVSKLIMGIIVYRRLLTYVLSPPDPKPQTINPKP